MFSVRAQLFFRKTDWTGAAGNDELWGPGWERNSLVGHLDMFNWRMVGVAIKKHAQAK